MKLQSIDLDGFGVLSDLTFAELDPGLSVIYGSNGSGKTTLLQFVRGIFCGLGEGRRIGLLPPADGRVGGGSLQVRWEGDICRFSRSDDPGVAEDLRVALVRSDLETPHPRFKCSQLRTDLVPLLYTVGNSDSHALDGLIQQARRDGIQLVGRPDNATQLHRAAAKIRDERLALLHRDGNTDAGAIAELTSRCSHLQVERDRLIDELRERARQWESTRARRPQTDILQSHHKVTWLRSELAAAECDLREAEDRRWMPQPPPRTVTVEIAPVEPPTRQRAPHECSHLDRQRIYRLEQLDRRIDHARTLLAEAACARLDISLRSARIAGSDDTPPGPFLSQIRDSLKSLEAELLDLRDESVELTKQPSSQCVCDEWQAATQEAVGELSKRLYRLCEQVSRYELQHQKSTLARAEQTIHSAEVELLRHLESLRAKRLVQLEAAGAPLAWKGRTQAEVEQDNCECLEHEPRQQWRLARSTVPTSIPPQRIVRTVHRVIERPTPAQLAQLRSRVELLRHELNTAVAGWRHARNWQPQQTLPEDISTLERQIDLTRIELDSVESQLAAARQRWHVLLLNAEAIRRMIEKQECDRRPTVIQWASGYLRELTGGRHVEIVVAEDGNVEIVAADGSTQPCGSLSRGTRDQLALSLKLALVRAYQSRGVSFPLILDDVLADTDQARLRAAVSLLQQFAGEQSQQIIYLTCQTHLAELFAQQQVSIRILPGSTEFSRLASANESGFSATFRGWVDRPHAISPTSSEQGHPQRSTARTRLVKPLHRRQPDGPYWLSMDAPASLIPSMGSQMGRRLAGLGVRTAGDLIDLDTSEISLRLASLQISPQRLTQWQAEAVLLCCVPDLTGPDAQMLCEAGVRSISQLADYAVDDLLRAIDGHRSNRQTTSATTTIDRDVALRWTHNARRARTLSDARRFSQGRDGSIARARRGAALRRGRGHSRPVATGVGGPGSRRPQAAAGRRILPATAEPDRKRSFEEAHPAVSGAPPVQSLPLRGPADYNESLQPLSFHLSLESPVVDAPSIGPTTANRLSRIGVITVADLLYRPAAEIARRLKNRRISEETVQMWQQQSRLMCRIPLLRGHDAQVLVACDITEAEQVASMTPEALFAVVGPFVATVKGQRLLRSSRTPDLAEVTDWIHWAGNSRTLRAA